MAVAYFTRWPKPEGRDPAEIARQINEGVLARLGGRPPAGVTFHAEGPAADGGWWVFNVWRSEEEALAFRREVMDGVYAAVGVPPGEAQRLDVWWDSTRAGGAAGGGGPDAPGGASFTG